MKHTTILLLLVLASSARAVTITVTTTNDSGLGSLRQAIFDANTNADLDTIEFDIADLGVQTISPTNQLPAITNSVVLDGYTQSGAEPNDLVNGNDAELRIQLDGSNAGQASGLILATSNSVVRGLVINAFHTPCCIGFGFGIKVIGSGNIIEGNFIGTDAGGNVVVGNGDSGVSILGEGNTIGGTTPAARNVISGNGALGVDICCSASSSNNNILGNYIGTDADGANFLGNGGSAVRIAYAPNNVVRGTNVIVGSGPLAGAVEIAEQGASGILIQGNFIGVAADGVTGFTNANYFGVDFSNGASSNIVGGTAAGAGNVIAFSSHAGVMVGRTNTNFGIERANAVLGNSIFANQGLGIDLAEVTAASGVTTNDVCDTDDGVNHLQNFPVLTLVTNTGTGIQINGFLDSVSSKTYRLEFFDNADCDPSGFGEGETFIDFTNVTTGADCTNTFNVTFTNSVPDCHFVTATATDPDNNTSEFSPCEVVQGNPSNVVCTLTPQLATNFVGVTHVVTNLVTKSGQPAAGVIVFSRITAGPNTGLSAVATNDNNGLAEFSYTSATNGTDTITVTGRVCAVDFQCTATKVWLPPIQADLRLTKIDSPDPILTGTNLTYTITITNAGPDTASSVSVADNLPASTTFSTCNAPNGGTCGGSGNNRTVTYASLPVGQSRTITFVAAVNCNVTNGTLISNTATVSSSATDANAANNFATATTTATNPPPTIICPADVISATGGSNVVVVFNSPSVADNCPGTTVVAVPLSGSTFNPGTNLVVATATDAGGATNSCTLNVIVPEAPSGVHDLAVTKLKAPKSVRLKGGSVVNKRVTVTIQNRSPHDETIRRFNNLLDIAATSLGDCPALVLTLINGKPNKDLPFTIKTKHTMKLSYTATFSCANDPAKGKGHEDFSFTATVNHAAIDGNADSVPENNTCPRPPNPAIDDKGCGAKSSNHNLGADVLTDVAVK